MGFKNRDLISIRDLSTNDILRILAVARDLPETPALRGKVLASLFFEPSTRTRLSFATAMQRLGGSVIGFSDPASSSAKKGETLWDTAKMAEAYSDVIVIRHHREGAARLAAEAASVPVINAGDGANQHPTQTLLDLYTIHACAGKLSGLRVGFVGDLRYGRTVHSLALALARFGNTLHFIAPEPLQLPDPYLAELNADGTACHREPDLQDTLPDLDILYATRLQEERFPDPLEYRRYQQLFRIDRALLARNPDVQILHPLPRRDEISRDVDSLPGAQYYRQAANGVRVRQAILSLLLGAV